MKNIRLLIILFVSSFMIGTVQAQDDCTIILRKAVDTYDAGNLESIPEMLKSCLDNGFNKNEKVQAYRLLALAYLYDNKVMEAKDAMFHLLKINPEFQINEAIDPIEFQILFESYNTSPIFSVGINGGINLSNITLLETFGVDNFTNSGTYKSDGIGYQFGIHGSIKVIKRINANIDVLFKGTKFSYNNSYQFNSLENSSDELGVFGELNANETHTWISVPISFTYDYNIADKISVNGRLGSSLGILLSAKNTFIRSYDEKYSLPDVSGVTLNMKENRTNFNFWLVGGVGLKYKVTKGNLFVDVRYNYGLKNLTNEDQRYSNPALVYQYFYIDDNFKLNDLAFSVGYTRHFYNPKLKGDSVKKEERGKKKKKKLTDDY